MLKLLKAYIKYNIKIIALVIITMSISVGGAFSIMLAEHSEYTNHFNFQKENSSIFGARGENVSEKEYKSIEKFESIRECIAVINYGSFVDNTDGKITHLEGFDKNVQKLFKLDIKSGRYPINSNEVVVFNSSGKYRVGDELRGRIIGESNQNEEKIFQ